LTDDPPYTTSQHNEKGPMKEHRGIEKTYPTSEFVSKLRRLADRLEAGEPFESQIMWKPPS